MAKKRRRERTSKKRQQGEKRSPLSWGSREYDVAKGLAPLRLSKE